MFKFRSGTNALNEELGRHRGRNGDRQCKLCGDECESVVHVLWECPVYDSIRNTFMGELDKLLEGIQLPKKKSLLPHSQAKVEDMLTKAMLALLKLQIAETQQKIEDNFSRRSSVESDLLKAFHDIKEFQLRSLSTEQHEMKSLIVLRQKASRANDH